MKLLASLIFIFMLIHVNGCEKKSSIPEPKIETLFMAAQYGNVQKVQELVKKGANVNKFDSHGKSPLMYAVMEHHLAAAKTLVSMGANIHVNSSSGSDLVMLSLYSIDDPSLDMFDFLISLGLDTNNQTVTGESALNIAIDLKHEAAVARLISYGSQPNEKSLQLINTKDYPSQSILMLVKDAKSKREKLSKLSLG